MDFIEAAKTAKDALEDDAQNASGVTVSLV